MLRAGCLQGTAVLTARQPGAGEMQRMQKMWSLPQGTVPQASFQVWDLFSADLFPGVAWLWQGLQRVLCSSGKRWEKATWWIRWIHLAVQVSSLSPCLGMCFFSGSFTSFTSYFLALPLLISTVSVLLCIPQPLPLLSVATFEHPSSSLHLCCCLLPLTLGCNKGFCLCEAHGQY